MLELKIIVNKLFYNFAICKFTFSNKGACNIRQKLQFKVCLLLYTYLWRFKWNRKIIQVCGIRQDYDAQSHS